ALVARSPKGGGARISPDVGSIATILPELDAVTMRSPAVLVDEDELVLTAIEGSHPGVVLDPDAEVQELGVHGCSGGEQLCQVTPVDADIVQRAVDAMAAEQGTHTTQ